MLVLKFSLPACFLSSVAIIENKSDNVTIGRAAAMLFSLTENEKLELELELRRLNFGLFKGEALSHGDDDMEMALVSIFHRSLATTFEGARLI